MDEYDRTLRYLFILAIALIVVAYYVGSTSVLKTFFAGVNQTGLTFTGRDASGQFAGYPK